MNNIVETESGLTILFNVDNNSEQCGQHNIVQSCSYQYCINLIFTRVVVDDDMVESVGLLASFEIVQKALRDDNFESKQAPCQVD